MLELRRVDGLGALEPGASGELIVTPLYSEATQLVRYATGDVVSCIECGCGTSGRALVIDGREDDAVVVRDRAVGPDFVEHAVFVIGDAGDYLLEVDENKRLIGAQILPMGDAPVHLDAIAAELDAPARVVERLPALARAGGAVKSWRRTRTVTVFGDSR